MNTYDAIIIGGGHNGLVTACYLARAKWKVLVLERRYIAGGACVSEENTFPGFKVSTAAYVNRLVPPGNRARPRVEVVWVRTARRDPASFSPFLDGRYLMLGGSAQMNVSEIAKFSAKDAQQYPKYEDMLRRVASVIEPTLIKRPPNVVSPSLTDLLQMGMLGLDMKKLGTGMAEALEVLTGAARPILNRWFESEDSKQRWAPMRSSAPLRHPPCRGRRTCSSIT